MRRENFRTIISEVWTQLDDGHEHREQDWIDVSAHRFIADTNKQLAERCCCPSYLIKSEQQSCGKNIGICERLVDKRVVVLLSPAETGKIIV